MLSKRLGGPILLLLPQRGCTARAPLRGLLTPFRLMFLQVSSKDMFQFFFSDEASDFLYNFHTARGDQGQTASPAAFNRITTFFNWPSSDADFLLTAPLVETTFATVVGIRPWIINQLRCVSAVLRRQLSYLARIRFDVLSLQSSGAARGR